MCQYLFPLVPKAQAEKENDQTENPELHAMRSPLPPIVPPIVEIPNVLLAIGRRRRSSVRKLHHPHLLWKILIKNENNETEKDFSKKHNESQG